jgi:hypothetical protein
LYLGDLSDGDLTLLDPARSKNLRIFNKECFMPRFRKRDLSRLTAILCLLTFLAAIPASAGTWSTPVVLGTNAYSGSVTVDAAGNMISVWYQNQLPNGTPVNSIWASSAAFGQRWSAPVNVSGSIGVASGNPIVRGSASGNVTAIYTSPTLGGTFVDHPAGGPWKKPGSTNGVNQFFVNNDDGDEGLAWGIGATRPGAGVTSIAVVQRPAGGTWSAATTVATGTHLNFDGSVLSPDGSMAVAWESFDAVCGSRVCKTSNWVLHVTTRAAGAQSWVDSGPLLGPDSTQHFGQLAADKVGDLGIISISAGNLVSLVRHGTFWTAPAVVAPTSSVGFYTGTGRDNRVYAGDYAGHATLVSWNTALSSLVAVDGNLTTNTWGKVTTISGPDQFPNYFDFAMSETGTAIAFWSIDPSGSGNTTWRAATRKGPGVAWNAPATVGTSLEGGGVPESAAVNGAGQAVVVFHGYSSDFLTYIEYTNTYQP